MPLTTNLAERPDAKQELQEMGRNAWPEFLHHGNIHNWKALFDAFSRFQILLCGSNGELVGVGHTVPIVWNGTPPDLPQNMDAVILRALEAQKNGVTPTTLSALAVIVHPQHQRKGYSAQILQAMRELASQSGCASLIAPVRPVLKSSYPLTPFDRYLEWKRDDGLPFDPWLRVHAKLGAEVLKVIPEGVLVEGTVSEWESWTGLRFPDSGSYTVAGALQPVEIDTRQDLGRYADPGVWMLHPLDR